MSLEDKENIDFSNVLGFLFGVLLVMYFLLGFNLIVSFLLFVSFRT